MTVNLSMHYARVLSAIFIGCTLGFLPMFTVNLSEHGIVGLLKFGIQGLTLPAAAVGLILTRNVHGIPRFSVEIGNSVLYSWLLYVLLKARSRQKAKS